MRLLVGLAVLLVGALPSCTSTANVSDVWTSLDEDGARRRTLFFSDSQSVVCLAKAGIGRNNATIEMRIRRIREVAFGQGTDGFQSVNRVVAATEFHPGVTGTTPAILALRLAPLALDPETGQPKEDTSAPYAPGSYVCEVSLDGEPAGSAPFNIQYADCPVASIVTGQVCAGFYPIDPPATCPQRGASGDREPVCTCNDAARGWECDE